MSDSKKEKGEKVMFVKFFCHNDLDDFEETLNKWFDEVGEDRLFKLVSTQYTMATGDVENTRLSHSAMVIYEAGHRH